MSVRPATLARTAPVSAGRAALRGFLEREGIFGWLMLAPGVLFLLAFVAYPFFYGIFLSLQDRRVASPGTFVGFANFLTLARDEVFWQVVRNTFVYVTVTTVLKLSGGLGMALVMNQAFRGRNLVRAFLLLPFIVPTALSTVAWMWILEPTSIVVNWLLGQRDPRLLDVVLRHRHVGRAARDGRRGGAGDPAGAGGAHRRADDLSAAGIRTMIIGGSGLGGRMLRLYVPLAVFIVGMLFP